MPQAILNSYLMAVALAPPTPDVWYRSDFGVTLLTVPAVNGGLVDEWADKTGNGFKAVQATTAQQPTYNTGVLNGQPALNFPRTPNQLMTIPSSAALLPATNTAFSFFAVIRPTDFTSPMLLFEGDTGSGFVQWYIATTGKQIWSDGTESTPSSTSLTAGAWNRIGLRVPVHGSGTNTYYLQGAADGAPSQGISGSVGAIVTSFLGDRPPFVFPLIGDIVEFLFYTRDVTAPEIAAIDAYLVARYAL